MSPAGTVLSAPSTVSNVINTQSIRDGRVYIEIEALGGATTIDVEAQIAEVNDAAKFTTVKAVANPFLAAGRQVIALEEHEIGAFLRLKYVPDAGAATANAKLEGKEGV